MAFVFGRFGVNYHRGLNLHVLEKPRDSAVGKAVPRQDDAPAYRPVTCGYNFMSNQNEPLRTYPTAPVREKGGGPGSAGQSGDTQGLPDVAEAGPESVVELLEEGQFYEAEILLGVETAVDADVAEVRTTEVPEDDVPTEDSGTDAQS